MIGSIPPVLFSSMKPRFPTGFLVVVTVLIAAAGIVLTMQWQETMALRGELASVRADAGAIDRLRAENERLKAQQISAAELAQLRADHAALPRLRAEVEALNRDAAVRKR